MKNKGNTAGFGKSGLRGPFAPELRCKPAVLPYKKRLTKKKTSVKLPDAKERRIGVLTLPRIAERFVSLFSGDGSSGV